MAFYFCCVLRYVCNVFVQEGKRIMNIKAENQNTEARYFIVSAVLDSF